MNTDMDRCSDLERWASSSLFPNASSLKKSYTSREVREHLASHWVECPICRRSLKDGADVTEVGLASGGER